MDWFQHHVRDLDVQDAVFDIGYQAYYVFYKMHELYAEKFNSTDDDGYLSVSWSSIRRELQLEKEEIQAVLQWFEHRKRISSITIDPDKLSFKINGFDGIASNWQKRKRRGASVGASGGASGIEDNTNKENTNKVKGREGFFESIDPEVDEVFDDELVKVAQSVIGYLNTKTGAKFGTKSKTHQRFIVGRLKEGATEEDCKKCIDNMVSRWKDDPKMSMYLRPSTLFNASKFWGYAKASSGTGGGYLGSGVAI